MCFDIGSLPLSRDCKGGVFGECFGSKSKKLEVVGLFENLGILMIGRGMQRTFCCEVENGWKESLSQGIVIVGPKARTRDKPWDNL